MLSTSKMIIFGLLLLFAGAVLAFLMVLRLLEPSFLLSFLSYICTLTGLILGFAGLALYVRSRKQ
ncbi:MAG TPA: hypothetical protein PKV91_03685 [Bacillota bacterium]|jgi:hypothetical protein|nr:hypothetical protein [Bacillota bacterium]HOA35611.1 hypothetical protein [Bacillota bacterium]HOJ83968.1 hypothetical protein [Bacillota bacterium]HOL16001.1 hypothetical protein [Bacillota bacterium]HPZ11443.1 hypothetical protein [Bacillota bacterium]